MILETDKIILSKPKKSEASTYVCNVYNQEKKNPAIIDISTTYLLSKNDKNYLTLKTTDASSYNLLFDIANHIIEIVKSNFVSWFNTQMPEDLVDEYFCSPLTYDKKYGDIIKLKIVNGMEHISELKKRCTIRLIMNQVRIYKQKFIIEWSIDKVDYESSSDTESVNSDDEDITIPIEEIKTEYIGRLVSKLDSLNTLLALLKTADSKEVVKICEMVNEQL